MDAQLRNSASTAIRSLDKVIAKGPKVPHQDVSSAVNCVVSFRNRAIDMARQGTASRDCVDRANALVSLAYGADFPLIGFHLHRLEQTRDGMKALLKASESR